MKQQEERHLSHHQHNHLNRQAPTLPLPLLHWSAAAAAANATSNSGVISTGAFYSNNTNKSDRDATEISLDYNCEVIGNSESSLIATSLVTGKSLEETRSVDAQQYQHVSVSNSIDYLLYFPIYHQTSW